MKMVKHTFGVIAIFISITFVGCNNNSNKKNPDIKDIIADAPGINAGAGTYAITAPDGWEKTDTTIATAKFTIIKSPQEDKADNFQENINVVTENTKDYDLAGYFLANKKTMESQMQNFKIIAEGNSTIAALPAKWMNYSFTSAPFNLENKVYFVVKNKIAYVITCSAVQGKASKYEKYFDNCINSFSIK